MILVHPDTGEAVEVLPEAVLQPMEPLSLEDVRRKGNALHLERLGLIADYRAAVERKATAQAEYRRVKAVEMLTAKAAHGATVAEAIANGTDAVADAYQERILAEGLERAAFSRLRLSEEDRATFHRIAEWARNAPGAIGD